MIFNYEMAISLFLAGGPYLIHLILSHGVSLNLIERSFHDAHVLYILWHVIHTKPLVLHAAVPQHDKRNQ